MCETRNSRHIQVHGRRIRIDGCMVSQITSINRIGVKTLGCCCGHGRYSMTVVVQREDGIYEYFSNKRIPRTRRFYRRDSDGYYYIPEVDRSRTPEVG